MNICEMFDISGGFEETSRHVRDITTLHEERVRS